MGKNNIEKKKASASAGKAPKLTKQMPKITVAKYPTLKSNKLSFGVIF